MVSLIIVFYEDDMHLIPSMVEQTKKLSFDHEVIFVDNRKDKSEDVTVEGCIVVKNEDYKSVYRARKTGFYASKGKWIWFVDIDDEIYDFSLKKLTSDMNVFSHYECGYMKGSPKVEKRLPNHRGFLYDNMDRQTYYIFPNGLWCKIFKSSLLKTTYENSDDYEHWMFEDFYLSFLAYSHCKSITFCSDFIYTYIRKRSNSYYDIEKYETETKECLDLMKKIDPKQAQILEAAIKEKLTKVGEN